MTDEPWQHAELFIDLANDVDRAVTRATPSRPRTRATVAGNTRQHLVRVDVGNKACLDGNH